MTFDVAALLFLHITFLSHGPVLAISINSDPVDVT